MFGTLGGPEIALILVIALIVFGPRRLPEMGRSMGKMLAEFRKASADFKRTIEEEVDADKARVRQATAEVAPAGPAPAISAEAAPGPAADAPAAVPGPPEAATVVAPAEPGVSRDEPSPAESR
jgi:TatA/E family protein of Tat protein translocase